jgi:N-acetyl sugar amidotransferase
VRYCARCILPDTRPGLVIGADGVCGACRAHAERPRIDWKRRERDFRDVVRWARRGKAGYDCLIPVSGGKDSTWQTAKCLEAGLRPLAVTWKTPARTEIGQKNLDNLVSLGVDHIDYQVSPAVEARFMWKTFEKLGSTAVPMHLALFNIPLKIAQSFRIPLVVWGEDSGVEYAGEKRGFEMDDAWLKKYGVTHGTTAEDWVGGGLSRKDLAPYEGPSVKDLKKAGVRAVFLGHYFPWDPETSLREAEKHGFRRSPGGARTGLYDYADIDDDFISIHHWLKWYKFGITRLFDNLSLEIRNGRMTRDAALRALAEKGEQRPNGDIEKFCSFAGKRRDDFFAMAEKFRNKKIWSKDGGAWRIRDFILPDWRWT